MMTARTWLQNTCYNKVAGTLGSNCIPATPIDAFVGVVIPQRWLVANKPGRSTKR